MMLCKVTPRWLPGMTLDFGACASISCTVIYVTARDGTAVIHHCPNVATFLQPKQLNLIFIHSRVFVGEGL
jgi:hypothetical protein